MMKDHASDCQLHGPPAQPPTRCTCGASLGVRVFQYRVRYDCYGWEEHSRESLIASVAASALVRIYGREGSRSIKGSVLLRRAIQDDFTQLELDAVRSAWLLMLTPPEEDFKERHGLLCMVTALDGSPLSDEDLGRIVHAPDEAEIKAALAPWCEFWASEGAR